MSGSTTEQTLTIAALSALIMVYLYLLISPSQPRVSERPRGFVIIPDTKANFQNFMKTYKESYSASSWDRKYESFYGNLSEWGADRHGDDFFLESYGEGYKDLLEEGADDEPQAPNVPSTNFRCKKGWLTIRSELNFKYLWMHAGENQWLGATATVDTPLHRKSFEVTPVHNNCTEGWVTLREADSDKYIMMVAPTGSFALDEWAVVFGSNRSVEVQDDFRYHFLLEEEGYLLNKGAMAFVNVMPEAEYSVRGHTGGWDRSRPAGREYGAMMRFSFLNESLIDEALEKEEREARDAAEEDRRLVSLIHSLPPSDEKRVISFGLYGAKEKYTVGAIHNAELASVYFPGWVCRYYVTADVPAAVVNRLKELGAEIEDVPAGMGYSAGMFWRFMVADDPTVDRYIVRDVDSRLNARDRYLKVK